MRQVHPYHKLLWTPAATDPRSLWMMFLADCRKQAGGRWRDIYYRTDIRLRELRKMRDGRRKAVSDVTVDRLIFYCESNYQLSDLPWYTATELVDMGVWAHIDGPDPVPAPTEREPSYTLTEHRRVFEEAREMRRQHANARRALKVRRTAPPPINVNVVFDPSNVDDPILFGVPSEEEDG